MQLFVLYADVSEINIYNYLCVSNFKKYGKELAENKTHKQKQNLFFFSNSVNLLFIGLARVVACVYP